MFAAPLRLLNSVRPRIPAGVFAATAVSTIVFAATPFLVPAIAGDRRVSTGVVGLISTFQLLGFMLSSWLVPRWFGPRRRMMVAAIALGVVANVSAAFAPTFPFLLGMQFVSGLSLGLIAWISWAEVFGDDERLGDVAIIGPIVGTIASPVLATVIDRTGPDELFLLLAALYLVPLPLIRSMRLHAPTRPRGTRHRPVRAAMAILVALTALTLGGSAAFVFVGAIGEDSLGLSPVAVALVLSAHALTGIPSARYRGRRIGAGLWLGLTALSALLVTLGVTALYIVALLIWGFAYWMGIPGAYSLLAERSAYPEERAGDAQAVMAGGRVIGPLLGGFLYEISPLALGIGAATVMLGGSVLMVIVEQRVRPISRPAFTTRR